MDGPDLWIRWEAASAPGVSLAWRSGCNGMADGWLGRDAGGETRRGTQGEGRSSGSDSVASSIAEKGAVSSVAQRITAVAAAKCQKL